MKKTGKNKRKGNAIIEFAIIAPVMIAMMFAVMDFSRVFYFGEIASGAARAGTEYALLSTSNAGNTSGMIAAATSDANTNTPASMNFQAQATTFCECAGSTTQISCSSSCGSSAMWYYAQVTTTIQFSTFFNYYLLPQTLSVAGASTVRVQ
jgi:Flp pilus assembly protein TadG